MRVLTATILGVEPVTVEVECDLSPGLPFFQVVGLPDAILRESKVRVKSAIIQAGFEFPYDHRVVLNLSPSRIPKEGSGLELALAVRILLATNQIEALSDDTYFLGELGLDGSVRAVPELSALALAAARGKVSLLVVPQEARLRVDLPSTLKVVRVGHLKDMIGPDWKGKVSALLSGALSEVNSEFRNQNGDEPQSSVAEESSVDGNNVSRWNFEVNPFWARLFEIIALGEHPALIVGPPGCGKTFFAEKLHSYLEPLVGEKALQVQSLDALFERDKSTRPFVSPHHSATMAGLLGGGSPPQPGAVTRAHGGVLFLDEVFEFSQRSLDALRELLETKKVNLLRGGHQVKFPADVLLVAATNPCRCGNYGHLLEACRCREYQRDAYRSRVSGPLLDRFDLRVWVPSELMVSEQEAVGGVEIAKKLNRVRLFRETVALNDPKWCPEAQRIMDAAQKKLSLRGQKAIRRLGATIARLDMSETIREEHVREALFWQANWVDKVNSNRQNGFHLFKAT